MAPPLALRELHLACRRAVYPEVLAEVEDWGADLIIIGSHRPTMATYLLLDRLSGNQSFHGRSPICPETVLDNGKPGRMIVGQESGQLRSELNGPGPTITSFGKPPTPSFLLVSAKMAPDKGLRPSWNESLNPRVVNHRFGYSLNVGGGVDWPKGR